MAWGLIALDLGVDTTTSTGRLIANVMAAVAEWEREAIAQRTRDGFAEARDKGVRLGRPPLLASETRERVREERGRG